MVVVSKKETWMEELRQNNNEEEYAERKKKGKSFHIQPTSLLLLQKHERRKISIYPKKILALGCSERLEKEFARASGFAGWVGGK